MSHYKGLNNIGNTCYLNASLQMLLQNIDFCKVIMNNLDKSPKINTLGEFILKYYKSPASSISPHEVKSLVETKKSLFCGFAQQDSGEFLIYFLDLLNDETKGEISKLFEIETLTTLKCKLKVCLNKTFIKGKENFLILPIKQEYKTLDDCYRGYKTHDMLKDDNMVFCEKCQDKRIFSTRLEINNWPKHLIIWLKRFDKKRKINQDIEIPLKWRHDYILMGAVYHSGNVNGGHYFYLSRDLGSNNWFMLNDSSVSQVESSHINNYLNKGYIFYYLKK
jgi:ubiquitin C-terminal hydrolase